MKKWVSGIGLIALCGICCAFPFLFVGAAGALGFIFSPWVALITFLLGGLIFIIYSKRHKKITCSSDESCGCNSNSGG